MRKPFGERLLERTREQGALCVGIDPSGESIVSWGRNNDIEGLEHFSRTMLEAAIDVASVVKPQVAYFERFGARGFAILERVMQDARDAELLIIADAKRGDIGSTNEGYAQAWLDEHSPLRADAVTVSPYLGVAALLPLAKAAKAQGRGLFVLAATSNPEGRTLQQSRTSDNETVESFVLRELASWNEDADTLGSFGAVVGATVRSLEFAPADLRGPYLIPGVGAQGGEVEAVGRMFERCVPGSVLVNVGRGISQAGPDVRALRDSARRWRDAVTATF